MSNPDSNSYSFDRAQTRRLLMVLIVLAVVVLSGVLFSKIYESPSNVFWGMVENNLSTAGATMHISESQGGASLNEYIQFELGSKNLAHSLVALNESGTIIKTETISNTTTDYTRYTSISSKARPSAFNSVINVWASSLAQASGQSFDPLNHLLGQTILGVVPYANFSVSTKQSLVRLAQLDHVYRPDLAHLTHGSIAGHQVYVYTVSVAPQAYAVFMQQVSHDEGLGDSSAFNPSNYSSASLPLSVQLSIDPLSRQLLAINYGNGHTETVSGYGYQPTLQVPTRTISINELQTRLEAISR